MNDKEKILEITKKYKVSGAIEIMKRKYTHLYEKIDKNWKYPEKVSFSEKIYYFLYQENPFCEHGKKRRFISLSKGYFSENVAKCKNCKEEIKKKREKTCLEKYGVKSSLQSEKIRIEAKNTLIKKYGTDHPSKSSIIREKMKKTFMKKYGVEHPLKSKKIKEKVKETWKKKDRCSILEIEEKKRKTWIKKYGTINPFRTKKIKEKIKNTCIEKYGVTHPLKNEEIKENFKKKFSEKYGVETPFLSEYIKEKIKNTWIEKYGTEHPSKSLKIKEKKKNTFLKKYSVEHNSQINIKNFENWKNNFSKIYEIYEGNEKEISKYFNVDITAVRRKAIEFGLREKYFSSIEKNIQNFLSSKKILFESRNRKILNGLEIDIYIPEKFLGIEIHGLFWHSYSKINNKKYHYEKFIHAKEKEIILLQIFEDEWYEKQNKIKQIIENFLNKEYNFINFTKRKLIVDNRFHPGCKILESNGYVKEKDIPPKKWYTDYIIRKSKIFENYKDTIYDAGYEIWVIE